MNMADRVIFAATLLAALGSGLIAGLFFVFSNTIMKALGRLSPADGSAAMQSINARILNPLFLTVFMGTGVISTITIVISLLHWPDSGSLWLLLGGLIYLMGSILVTLLFNVPLNEVLARTAPGDPSAAGLWKNYLITWTRWNHVRTVASLASSAAFILALVRRAAL